MNRTAHVAPGRTWGAGVVWLLLLALQVTREGEEEIVTTDEPGATALSRLWLWMLSSVITEDLL